MASSGPNASKEDMESLLRSIQRDPVKAGAGLPSLSQSQLLHLFSVFIDNDDDDDDDDSTTPLSKDPTSTSQRRLRPSAFVALSSYISSVRNARKSTDHAGSAASSQATDTLVKAFSPTIEDTLRGTNVSDLTAALAFLSALFQVDPQTSVAILRRDGNIECVSDVVELLLANASSPSVPGVPGLGRELANLLSHVAGHSVCRKALIQHDQTVGGEGKVKRWLDHEVEGQDKRTRAAAVLTLVKLHQGRLQDAEQEVEGLQASSVEEVPSDAETRLAELMEAMVLGEASDPTSSKKAVFTKPLLDAIEGLAYLSVHSSVKTYIASSPALIKALLSIGAASSRHATEGGKKGASFSSTAASREKAAKLSGKTEEEGTSGSDETWVNVGLHYGLALLFANLCHYRPRLGKEQEQIAKLRSMTKPSKASNAGGQETASARDEDAQMNDEAVKARIVTLCKAGLLPVLAGLARSESASARRCVARVYAAVVDDGRGGKMQDEGEGLRGKVLAAGGGRALLGIIKTGPKEGAGRDWVAIQALSKLAITASPLQVFGPDIGTTYDAIPVFGSVLTYSDPISSSTSGSPLRYPSGSDGEEPNDLQRFEALMALTNIASLGEEVANRIVSVKGLWDALENGMLDESHEGLMRRAATELVCNLVVTPKGFEMFVPPSSSGIQGSKTRQESRLHLLLALSDVEDVPTRKAASGALAMLTSDEIVCLGLARLQRERRTVLGIIGRLLLEDPKEDEAGGCLGHLRSVIASGKHDLIRWPEPKSVAVADRQLVHRGVVILRNLAVLLVGSKSRRPEAKELVEDMANEGTVGMVEQVVRECVASGEKGGPVISSAVEFAVVLRGYEG